jgi:sulfhydrogenase subunit delta
MSAKPRVAVFDFACCEGCQLQLINLEEGLLDLLQLVEPVEWREAMSEKSDSYEIAIVEGSIARPEEEARLRQIRARARTVIALGACATIGGVNKLANTFDRGELRRCVYPDSSEEPVLRTSRVKALDEVIDVDVKIEGCPVDAQELAHVLKCVLMGREPRTPDYPVCVECKMRENGCRYDYGEVCLGPITRAGCNARCPSNGHWCFGCRGWVSDANIDAARQVMREYGKTPADLAAKMALFGSR